MWNVSVWAFSSALDGRSCPVLAHVDTNKCAVAASDGAIPAAELPLAVEAGDMDWAVSEDDGADDEATLDADEQAAAAEGVNMKVRACAHVVAPGSKFTCAAARCRFESFTESSASSRCVQEEHAAETSALADEAEMPLEQLLASYGFRIGPGGTKQRIVKEPEPAAQTVGPSDARSDGHGAEQLNGAAKQERRQSPRIRPEPKPEAEEAVRRAIKSEAAALTNGHPATINPEPASPAETQVQSLYDREAHHTLTTGLLMARRKGADPDVMRVMRDNTPCQQHAMCMVLAIDESEPA